MLGIILISFIYYYDRLPPKAHNCRKRKCGHSNQLRIKKKPKDWLILIEYVNSYVHYKYNLFLLFKWIYK